MCFFVHILPKLYYFRPIPSSLLLAFLHPAAGSFLLPAQPCFPLLAPLLTPALLLSLLVLVSFLCLSPCESSPRLSYLGAPRYLSNQLFNFCVSLRPPFYLPWLLFVSLLGDCLLSSCLPCSSRNPIQSLLLRQYQFHNSSSDPWFSPGPLFPAQSLVPAVVLRLCLSSSLYAGRWALKCFFSSAPAPRLYFRAQPVSVFVPQAVSPAVFLLPFPSACWFRCLSSLHSDHMAFSSS